MMPEVEEALVDSEELRSISIEALTKVGLTVRKYWTVVQTIYNPHERLSRLLRGAPRGHRL